MENMLILSIFCIFILPCTLGGMCPAPVGFWMFDYNNQGKDLSGNGNDAVLYNTVMTRGPFFENDNAIEMTAPGDISSRIVIPNNGALTVSHSMTWMTWVKVLTDSQGPLFSIGNLGVWGHVFWICCGAAGTLHGENLHIRFDHPGLTSVTIKNVIVHPKRTYRYWSHLAVTYDHPGQSVKVYVNGSELISARFAHSYDLDDNYAEVNIGALPGDARELHAGIFCTMYFDLALDATQISAAQSLCRLNAAQAMYPWPNARWSFPLKEATYTSSYADGPVNRKLQPLYLKTSNKPFTYGPFGHKNGAVVVKPDHRESLFVQNPTSAYDKLEWTSFTLSMYIKPEGIYEAYLYAWPQGDTCCTLASNVKIIGTQLQYTHYSTVDNLAKGDNLSPEGTLTLYNWNHIVITYDFTSGYSYIYSNGALKSSYNHGSHPMDTSNSMKMNYIQNLFFKADLSCLQFYDFAMPEDMLGSIKEYCIRETNDYHTESLITLPLSQSYGLWTKERKRRLASSSATISHAGGWRKRLNEASVLSPGTLLTLPAVMTGDLTAFSIAVHIKPSADTEIQLLNSAVVFDATNNRSITVSVGTMSRTYANLIDEENLAEYTWLGVTYSGYSGTLIIYVNGEPEILEWVGYDHILTSSLIEVSNVAGSTALECYQLYDKALNMMEMFVTRDKCIRDAGPKALPLPRGFWPLNNRYQTKDLTGRSGDFDKYPDTDVTFDAVGPTGLANEAAHFAGNAASKLYAAPSKGFEIKFSMTIAFWVSHLNTSLSGKILHGSAPGSLSSADRRDDAGAGISVSTANNGKVSARLGARDSEQFVAEYCYDKMPASAKDQEWIHVAVTYNFLTKKCYLYINGERTSHKDTTGARVVVKTHLEFQLGTSSVPVDIACLQMYDVALTAEQVKKTMGLCKTHGEGIQSTYRGVADLGTGVSRTTSLSTTPSTGMVDCLQQCMIHDICDSVGYGGGECDIAAGLKEDTADNEFSQTGDEYLESYFQGFFV